MNGPNDDSTRAPAFSRISLSGHLGLDRLAPKMRELVPVTYLRAPIGFGKSALVDEWINERLSQRYNVVYLDAAELTEEISQVALMGTSGNDSVRDEEHVVGRLIDHERGHGISTSEDATGDPLSETELQLMLGVIDRIEALVDELNSYGPLAPRPGAQEVPAAVMVGSDRDAAVRITTDDDVATQIEDMHLGRSTFADMPSVHPQNDGTLGSARILNSESQGLIRVEEPIAKQIDVEGERSTGGFPSLAATLGEHIDEIVEPDVITGSLSLPVKFFRPDPSVPRKVSDRLFALGAKVGAQPYKVACVVEGFAEIAPRSSVMGKFLISIIRALPDTQILVVARAQSQVESTLSAVSSANVLTPADLKVTALEIAQSVRGVSLGIGDGEAESILKLSMGWPALAKLILARTVRLPNGQLEMSPGNRAAGEFLQNALKSNPLDLESVLLLSVALLDSFSVRDAHSLYLEVRNLVPSVAKHVLRRELTDVERIQLDYALVPGEIRLMCHSLASVGLIHAEIDLESGEEQRYGLHPLVRNSALELINSLPSTVRSAYLSTAVNLLVGQGNLAIALSQLVALDGWELLLKVVENNWWELLELPTTSVYDIVERIPQEISRKSMHLHALVVSQRDEAGLRAAEAPQTVLSALLGQAPSRSRLCPESDFVGLSEHEIRTLADSLITWGFSRFLAGDLATAQSAYQVAQTSSVVSAAIQHDNRLQQTLLTYQAALDVLRGECERVEASRAELDLLAGNEHAHASEIAVTILNWQRNSQLEQCMCDDGEAWTGPTSMLQGIRTSSHNFCAMAGDTAHQSLQRLEDALATLPTSGSHLLVRYLLTDAYAHVLMRLDRVPEARALLVNAGPAPRFAEARARLAYFSGQFDDAIKLCEEALANGNAVPREVIALHTIIAVCALELRDQHLAFDAMRHAYELAKKHTVWLYFALIPQTALRTILERAPEVFAEVDAKVAGRYVSFPSPHKLGSLSPKEREVLAALSQEGSIAATARSLFLGVNTVKTHTRNIYRKLQVHSVAEAVAQAREFGLVP